MRATRAALAGGASVLVAACVANPAPQGWLPSAEVAATEAWGGWVTVDTSRSDRGEPREVSGELIAVDPDSVFVMADSTLIALGRARARRATVFGYDAQWSRLASWGVGGTVAALSNGWFFALTGPAWIIAGSASAASQSRAPRFETSDSAGWEGLRPYARFPQGLPDGLDRAHLRPVTPRPAGP